MLLLDSIRYKQAVLYIIFGILTTLVNIFVYYILISCSIHYTLSNAIAIAIAILFAYATNKVFVFQSCTSGWKELTFEFIRFIGSRLASSIYDMLSMFIFISIFHWGELISKVITGVAVVVINYILSKKFTFTQSS